MSQFTRLPPAPTLAPLAGAGDPRAALRLIAAAGLRHVQLSAALPGMRPRDLDRSGRRDLLARLRRSELLPAGLDLWIPLEHFTRPEHADRAAAAVLETIELAADLGRIPLSLRLAEGLDNLIVEQWRVKAETCGVRLADHAPRPHPLLSVGVDPAVLIASGQDPAACASNAGDLVAARLSDFRDEARVVPGVGRLDLLAYQVALVARGFEAPVALDLRRLGDPRAALDAAVRAWAGTGLLTASAE